MQKSKQKYKKNKKILKKIIIEQERMDWPFDSLERAMVHYQTTI